MTFAFEGLTTLDALASRDTVVKVCRDGVALGGPPGTSTFFIPLGQRPEPGRKVLARGPLTEVLDSPLVVRREAGGGMLRAGARLSQRVREAPGRGVVRLFDSGTGSAEVDAVCRAAVLECHALGRQPSPRSLIVPWGKDRLIIQEAPPAAPAALDHCHFESVSRGVAEANAVASVSPEDGAVAAAAAALANGARRYAQLTGALSPEMTLLLLTTTHEVLCNLEEWSGLARSAGVAAPGLGEDAAEAPEAASHLLRALRRRCWAGTEAAVCTLGRYGAVVADWVRDRVYHVGVELPDGGAGVPTPAGAGDLFLAEWIFWRETWSRRGHLRDPLAATGVRATRAVAEALGLPRGRCDVRARPC
jgi:hypothetical protein